MDPNTLIQDIIGFNVTAQVDNFIDEQLGLGGLENVDLNYLGYMPIFDPFGSFFFYPDHCYPPMWKTGSTRFNSPVIGYVRTGASVEDDIVAQLDSLFMTQRQMKKGISIMDIMGFNLEDVD